jgi:hypothetical protein|tara:strand:+ start:76 stop:336 length:261 start_codon:yes stop_codon:yes gene_type:complete
MIKKKGVNIMEFGKKDISLINDVWAFLSACEDGYLVDDCFSISSKKELAGWLLFESQSIKKDYYWKDADIWEQALFVKKGVEKYGK